MFIINEDAKNAIDAPSIPIEGIRRKLKDIFVAAPMMLSIIFIFVLPAEIKVVVLGPRKTWIKEPSARIRRASPAGT